MMKTNGEYPSQITVEESLVPVGSAATIHCETVTQQYSLDWRKNMQPITYDERIERKDTVDGFEHSLTIYSVRNSDEGEYGVVIKDSYTAVTKITVVESQEQIATEDFDISLHPTPSVTNALAQVRDRVNLQQAQAVEAYQLCNMEEYFDLRFSMQSLEIPVVVDEKRFVSVSYLSRAVSIQSLEKEMRINREPSYESSGDLTFMDVTIIKCNFITTDVRFEFTSSTSVGHAVAEAVVLTLIAQQSVQTHLSSQCTELRTNFVKQSGSQRLTVARSVPLKIVEELGIKLGDRWTKLDVVLLSSLQAIAADAAINKVPRIIKLEMDFPPLAFEKSCMDVTFDKAFKEEYFNAVLRERSITYPEKIDRQFTIKFVRLEFVSVYKVPQVFYATTRIDVAQKGAFCLRCKSSKSNTVDETFSFCGPLEKQDVAVTFPGTLLTTSESYIDSTVSLEIILKSDIGQNLLASKEVPLIRMEMISMELMASVFKVLPVTYSFSKPTQTECLEMKIVKPVKQYETSQRNFVDSVTKLELEFWSQTEHNSSITSDLRTVELNRVSAKFFGVVVEYFDVSTAFNVQPKMDEVIGTLPIKALQIVGKINRVFSDAIVSVISECRSQTSREFYADALLSISRTEVCLANFRAPTFEDLHVATSFEIQSQTSTSTVTLLMRAPTVTEKSRLTFSDDLIQESFEFRSRLQRSLEVKAEVFIPRKDSLIKKIKSAEFHEKYTMAIIEVRPERGHAEFTLLTPLPTLFQKTDRSFSDSVVSLITELHMENNFYTNNDFLMSRTCAFQMHLKAPKESNITVAVRFCVQDETENIAATLLARAPTVIESDERNFSDNLVKLVTELWSQMYREASGNANIYTARSDRIQKHLRALTVEDTHASIALEGYSKANGIEVILSERLRVYKLNRSFAYRTVDFMGTLRFQSRNSSFHAGIDVPIKRNDDQLYLQASAHEYISMSTSFEVQSEIGNTSVVLLGRGPTIAEESSRAFSSNLTKLSADMLSTMNRSLHTYFEAVAVVQETTEIWIEAVKEENSCIRTYFEQESESFYDDAVISIVQMERQFMTVRSQSLENIEIYNFFECCEEELSSSITHTSKQIIQVIGEKYSSEVTKIDIEISCHVLNEVMEFKPQMNQLTKLARLPPTRLLNLLKNSTRFMKSRNLRLICSSVLFMGRLRLVFNGIAMSKQLFPMRSEESSISSTSAREQIPVVQLSLSNEIRVKEGENVQLKCIISGSPLPSVQWKRNDAIIENNERYSIICDDGICILRILNVTEEDNAIFSCVAINLFGSTETQSRLIVEGGIMEDRTTGGLSPGSMSSQDSFTHQFQAPQFTLPLSDISVRENEVLQLKCVVVAEPMPVIRWTCNGKGIQADNKNIFTVYEDGIVILKIMEGNKEGLYVCEATNGTGSAQTQSFVRIYNPEVFLTTAIEVEDAMQSAEAVILSLSTSKFCSTAVVTEKGSEMAEDREGEKLRETFNEEEITTDQCISTGALNYVIEAEAITIKVTNYKLSAYTKLRKKAKKVREEELLKIIIEEEVIRTRTYLRVVERSARQFWTPQDYANERPPFWSQEVINERVKFERMFQNDEIHEFLEDKGIIERYIQLLKARETSEGSECETRFKLHQIEGPPEILENRQFKICQEQSGSLADDIGVFTVVHCAANTMRHAAEAYIILITRHQYRATFDIPSALHRVIVRDNEFEASIEESVKKQKYFPHSTLKPPHFIQSFTVFEEDFNTGLYCSVQGLPTPHIRISHNGCPILRNNTFFHVLYRNGVVKLYMQHILEGNYVCEAINAAGRALTECYIQVNEEWDEKQRRKLRKIQIENAPKAKKRENENIEIKAENATATLNLLIADQEKAAKEHKREPDQTEVQILRPTPELNQVLDKKKQQLSEQIIATQEHIHETDKTEVLISKVLDQITDIEKKQLSEQMIEFAKPKYQTTEETPEKTIEVPDTMQNNVAEEKLTGDKKQKKELKGTVEATEMIEDEGKAIGEVDTDKQPSDDNSKLKMEKKAVESRPEKVTETYNAKKIALHIEKQPEDEIIDASIMSIGFETAQASIRSTEKAKK
ncbi:unnamed protein product, partial [Litomosoides sigmodontis]